MTESFPFRHARVIFPNHTINSSMLIRTKSQNVEFKIGLREETPASAFISSEEPGEGVTIDTFELIGLRSIALVAHTGPPG